MDQTYFVYFATVQSNIAYSILNQGGLLRDEHGD